MTTVAIVGGGVYAPVLCAALARALPAGPLTLRLTARSAERLAPIAREAAARVASLRAEATVTSTTELAAALTGAGHVVLLVRVGGLAARARDEAFPGAEGLVGDEGLGPGGYANAWRTLPWFATFTATVRTHAPSATVWNLVAPLGITTRALLDAKVEALGVCELPLVTRERWSLGAGDVGYAGLNHLGWFWGRTTSALRALAMAPDVDAATLERFGAAPLRYYYELFDPAASARLGVTRATGRAEALAAMADEALDTFQTRPGAWVPARATPWFDRALVPMMAARLGGAPWEGYVNTGNSVSGGRRCAFAPEEAVIECAVTLDSAGMTPRVDNPPAPVARWLGVVARAEALAYIAARDRDGRALREALTTLPYGLPQDVVARLAAHIEEENVP